MTPSSTPSRNAHQRPLPLVAEAQRAQLTETITAWLADPLAFADDPAANLRFGDVVIDLLAYLVLQRYPTATAIDLRVHRGTLTLLGVRGPHGEALDEHTAQPSALHISHDEWWTYVELAARCLPLQHVRYISHDPQARARGDVPLDWPFLLPLT